MFNTVATFGSFIVGVTSCLALLFCMFSIIEGAVKGVKLGLKQSKQKEKAMWEDLWNDFHRTDQQ